MTYFADLSVCRYYPIDHEDKLIAIGWLDLIFEHALGDVDPDVVADLCELLVSPWEPYHCPGWHDCPYCRFTTGPRKFEYNGISVSLGSSNLFVPGKDCAYVAPSLILHYIDAHGYSPPGALLPIRNGLSNHAFDGLFQAVDTKRPKSVSI